MITAAYSFLPIFLAVQWWIKFETNYTAYCPIMVSYSKYNFVPQDTKQGANLFLFLVWITNKEIPKGHWHMVWNLMDKGSPLYHHLLKYQDFVCVYDMCLTDTSRATLLPLDEKAWGETKCWTALKYKLQKVFCFFPIGDVLSTKEVKLQNLKLVRNSIFWSGRMR